MQLRSGNRKPPHFYSFKNQKPKSTVKKTAKVQKLKAVPKKAARVQKHKQVSKRNKNVCSLKLQTIDKISFEEDLQLNIIKQLKATGHALRRLTFTMTLEMTKYLKKKYNIGKLSKSKLFFLI